MGTTQAPTLYDKPTQMELDAFVSAASSGDLRAVTEFLKKFKSSVNEKTILSGTTALMNAAAHGHKAVVLTLLENGAETDIKDRFGITPLMYAYECNEREIAAILREWADNGGPLKSYG